MPLNKEWDMEELEYSLGLFDCGGIGVGTPNLTWDVFNGKWIVITAVGHSDLSDLANLVGTFKPTYHLYAPAIFRMIPPKNDLGPIEKTFLQQTLFWDYCVPCVRNLWLCDDPENVTYSENYWSSCKKTRDEMESMGSWDGVRKIFAIKPYWVIQLLDCWPRRELIKEILPNYEMLHLVRDGFRVILDRQINGWDRGYDYMMPCPVTADYVRIKHGAVAPWFIEEEAMENWADYSGLTRSAHVWRVQVENTDFHVRYEDMIETPEKVAQYILDRFNVEWTEITDKIIEKIKNDPWRRSNHEITLNKPQILEDIQEPERSKFKKQVERLGYF